MYVQVLSDNKLGTQGAQCMCKMLSVNAGLRKLDLSGKSKHWCQIC